MVFRPLRTRLAMHPLSHDKAKYSAYLGHLKPGFPGFRLRTLEHSGRHLSRLLQGRRPVSLSRHISQKPERNWSSPQPARFNQDRSCFILATQEPRKHRLCARRRRHGWYCQSHSRNLQRPGRVLRRQYRVPGRPSFPLGSV